MSTSVNKRSKCKTGIYCGCGCDIRRTLNQFKLDCDRIICIDSQPYSEFGLKQSGIVYEGFGQLRTGYDGYYRQQFVKNLTKQLDKHNLKFVRKDGNRLYYKQDEFELVYLISTSIPEHLEKNKDLIDGFEVLIDVGHHPHIDVLRYAAESVEFVGNSSTSYCNDDPNDNGLMAHIFTDRKVQSRFKNFVYFQDGVRSDHHDWTSFYNNSVGVRDTLGTCGYNTAITANGTDATLPEHTDRSSAVSSTRLSLPCLSKLLKNSAYHLCNIFRVFYKTHLGSLLFSSYIYYLYIRG